MHSPFDEDKNRPDTNDPVEFTRWTASQKAKAVVECLEHDMKSPDLVIGADTIVVFQGKILGKPKSPEDAKEMLKMYKNALKVYIQRTDKSFFFLG
jgi:septum formation protein